MEYEKAHQIFRSAVEEKSLCPWCFRTRKIYYPEYDEAEAKHLGEGDTKQVFHAKGHRFRSDGVIEASHSTYDPHPSTERDTPPATTIDGEYRSPAPQNICQCGVVDYGLDDRTLSFLHTCLDNLVESWLPEDVFDEKAAHDMITRLRQYSSLSGQDEIVLTEAIRQGFENSAD